MARSASSLVPSATIAATSPFAGLISLRVPPSDALTNSPPMYIRHTPSDCGRFARRSSRSPSFARRATSSAIEVAILCYRYLSRDLVERFRQRAAHVIGLFLGDRQRRLDADDARVHQGAGYQNAAVQQR